MLVVRPDSQLARGRLELLDLDGVPLVGHPSCRGLARVEAQLRARGVEPEFAFRSTVNATIQALAGAGVGAAVLPALGVDPANEATMMRRAARDPAAASWRSPATATGSYPPAAQAFVAIAEAVCAEIAARRELARAGS